MLLDSVSSSSSSSSTVLVEPSSNAKCNVVISKGAGQPPMPSDDPEMEGQSVSLQDSTARQFRVFISQENKTQKFKYIKKKSKTTYCRVSGFVCSARALSLSDMSLLGDNEGSRFGMPEPRVRSK